MTFWQAVREFLKSYLMQGGGTTDYAVEIFHDALRHGTYRCFLVSRFMSLSFFLSFREPVLKLVCF